MPSSDSHPPAAFRPVQRQRWSILGGFQFVMQSARAKKELKAWCVLALLSLALAGGFALVLAISRVPHVQDIFPWPLQFFQKGLVIHVVFSFVVWFLSLLGALLTLGSYRLSNGSPRAAILGLVALWLGLIACILLFIPGLLDRGEPSLNNYVPVIIDPLYYAGLCLFAVSLMVQVLRLLINIPNHEGPFDPVTQGAAVAGFVYLVALACFGISLAIRWQTPLDASFNEDVFWAGGHVLQYVNTLILLIGWYVLGGIVISRPIIDPRFFKCILGWFLIAALFLLTLSIVYDPTSYAGRTAYTWAQYGLAPPTLMFVGAASVNLYLENTKSAVLNVRDPAVLSLLLSVIVFGLGGALGLFVDGADTRTPAHYHGVIGGVNITLIGLFFCFLFPILTVTHRSIGTVLFVIWSYAVGQSFHSLGLFMAGGYGAPRKTAGDAQGMEAIGAQVGLYLMGVGALVAVIGGIAFIWITSRSLIRNHPAP